MDEQKNLCEKREKKNLFFHVFIVNTYCENLVTVVDGGPSLACVLGDNGQSSWSSTGVFLGQAILRTKHKTDTKLFKHLVDYLKFIATCQVIFL